MTVVVVDIARRLSGLMCEKKCRNGIKNTSCLDNKAEQRDERAATILVGLLKIGKEWL